MPKTPLLYLRKTSHLLRRSLSNRTKIPPKGGSYVSTCPDRRWLEARQNSDGYDAQSILNRLLVSALAVKRGEAAFERDTVLFNAPAYRWQVLACITSIAASKRGALHVLDYGGSLGSVFFQHRAFLNDIPKLSWSVIDQPHIVEAGRTHLQGGALRFFDSIDEAEHYMPIDFVLFLSSLQYLPNPYATLRRVAATHCSHMIVDRIRLHSTLEDNVTIQSVPEEIYKASYPRWDLSGGRFHFFVDQEMNFNERARYNDGIDGEDHFGFFYERKN